MVHFSCQDVGDSDKAPASERTIKVRGILPRNANGVVAEQVRNLRIE